MAFPPNYGLERNNRARAKERKALERQEKRDQKSAQRKLERATAEEAQPTNTKTAEEKA